MFILSSNTRTHCVLDQNTSHDGCVLIDGPAWTLFGRKNSLITLSTIPQITEVSKMYKIFLGIVPVNAFQPILYFLNVEGR